MVEPTSDLRVVDLVAARITWVQVLSAGAVLTGALLALTGDRVVPFAPGFGVIPGWPWLYGWALTAAGIVLLSTIWTRTHLAAVFASYVATAVYAVLCGGFIALWVSWLAGDAGYYPPYPAAVYATFAGMHLLHADVERRARSRGRAALRRLWGRS